MMRCGKSCAGFSKVTTESETAVLANSAGAWRAGVEDHEAGHGTPPLMSILPGSDKMARVERPA